MKDRKAITGFTQATGYAFLSNFYPSTIYVDGKSYPTVEHAYQAYKTTNNDSRELIRKSKTPAEAKKLGRAVELRSDWNTVKLDLMRSFIRKKFENPFLKPLLIETNDYELIYVNTWNDTFFGVCKGIGQNWLGKILEEVREDLKKENQEKETYNHKS